MTPREVAEHELSDRGHDLDRLKALSDGVLSIAMTFLVFNINIPQQVRDLAKAAGVDANRAFSQSVSAAVFEGLISTFVGFAVSFAVLGVYWTMHTRIVRQLIGYDRKLLLQNIFMLMGVALVPATSAAQSLHAIPIPALSVAYCLNVAAISLAAAALWRRAVKMGYVNPHVTPMLRAYIHARIVVVPVIFALGIPLALNDRTLMTVYLPLIIPAGMAVLKRIFSPRIYAEADQLRIPEREPPAELSNCHRFESS